MTGADYIATARLSTKADETLAEPGQTCELVPETSLPWLLEQGLIATPDQYIAAAARAGVRIEPVKE